MKPEGCTKPNADTILRATQEVQRELNADSNLREPFTLFNLLTAGLGSIETRLLELPGWETEDLFEPGSCLAKICDLEGHMCGEFDCVKSLAKQQKQLMILFGNLNENETETELVTGCRGETEVKLVNALEFYSMFGSRTIAINYGSITDRAEVWCIERWREAIEVRMKLRQVEVYP